jgi:chromosome condensin MukBEF complex kleisin-like MukF subunit
MDHIDTIKKRIEETEVVLRESQENFKENPESYSARLLLMSTENYLADLLRELDRATTDLQSKSRPDIS